MTSRPDSVSGCPYSTLDDEAVSVSERGRYTSPWLVEPSRPLPAWFTLSAARIVEVGSAGAKTAIDAELSFFVITVCHVPPVSRWSCSVLPASERPASRPTQTRPLSSSRTVMAGRTPTVTFGLVVDACQRAAYVVWTFGFAAKLQPPCAPVVTVAIRTGAERPYGQARIEMLWPGRRLPSRPESTSGCPASTL